jgi:hypothetical protein
MLEKQLISKGEGVQSIFMAGWDYERFNFSNFPGTMVRITSNKKPGDLSSLDGGAGQQNPDRAFNPGGLDLRNLKVIVQPASKEKFKLENNFRSAKDLEEEINQIQALVNSGLLPEASRVKACFLSCEQNPELQPRIEAMLACLADILRIEEDRFLPTDPDLKELLVDLESS